MEELDDDGIIRLTYQWHVNGRLISGATEKELTVDTDRDGLFEYYVRVTNYDPRAAIEQKEISSDSNGFTVPINRPGENWISITTVTFTGTNTILTQEQIDQIINAFETNERLKNARTILDIQVHNHVSDDDNDSRIARNRRGAVNEIVKGVIERGVIEKMIGMNTSPLSWDRVEPGHSGSVVTVNVRIRE